MSWPMSQDYNEAIQSPALCFIDPELKNGEPATNNLGLPMPRSGNFADVYELTCHQTNRKYAVKCFTREVPGLRDRYAAISAYLKQVNLPFMVDFTYLDQGIRVHNQWYPVLKMDWVEGLQLNQFLDQYADKTAMLEALCQIWVRLAKRLRDARMAHCDLQHGNVLLVPGSIGATLAVKLIDYDGMFVPALAQKKSGEVGHPAFQHPQRLRDGTYSPEVDRFPQLVIYTALRSVIVAGRALWDRHDNGDNLLFRQGDLQTPGKSALFRELIQLGDPTIRSLADALSRAAFKPLEQTPLLEELVPSEPASAPTPARKLGFKEETAGAGSVFAGVTRGDSAAVVRRRASGRRRRKFGFVAGVCVLTLLAAGLFGGGLLFFNQGPSPTSSKLAVVQTNPKPSNKNPPTTKGGSTPTKPEPKPEPEPDPVQPKPEPVDLLKLVDVEKDFVRGKWSRQGKTLVSPSDFTQVRLQIPYVPPDEYMITVVAERKGGRDSCIGVGLIVGGRQCLAMVDSYPHLGFFSGLHAVDGKDSDANETSRKGQVLKNGHASEIVCSVRKTGLTVTVDGKTVIVYKGAFQRLSLRREWVFPNNQVLFIATFGCVYHITKIELTPISGQGKPISEQPLPDKPALQAQKAILKYLDVTAQARKDAEDKVADARKNLLTALDQAQLKATQMNQADLAKEIKDARASLAHPIWG